MNKKKYYIIGNSGLAKEILFLAKSSLSKEYVFSGFIDYKPSIKEVFCLGNKYNVLDQEEFIYQNKSHHGISLFIGIGNPSVIRKVAEAFRGYSFPNLIHPNWVGHVDSISMGKGNIITAGCIFTGDISVGSFNLFNLNTTVGHDTVIGDFNVINPGTNISGMVSIGNSNLIGTNAAILQGISMGNNCVLGASSLANKNIDNNQVMVGVPARPIGKK